MIHNVTSDLKSFKSLTFGPGLNILLTDKSEGASDRQSRNGAGKTSFVELIHFLFAGKADKNSIFRAEALAPYTFEARVDIGGSTLDVSRSGAKPSKVYAQGDPGLWSIRHDLLLETGDLSLTVDQWRALLGELLFRLDPNAEESGRFAPAFRSLFSYFARRQNSGGFQEPAQQSTKQQPWDQQVATSYLLGLDARIPQEFQEVRSREKAMTELRKAAKDGSLGRFFSSAATLRTQLTIAEARARRMRAEVTAFNVLPQYAEYEREASTLTREISGLNDENTIDRELILQLENALASEQPPAVANIERVYREAGVVLPGTVSRRFEEVADFHAAVVENRRVHLAAEVQAAGTRIAERDKKREQFDERRRQLMGILQSGGALDHYARLQDEASRAEAEVEGLRQRLATAEQIESTKVEIDIEKSRLLKKLQADLHERRSVISDAILIFEELSTALYEKAGSLTVSATPTGPQIEVRIEAQRSRGINSMQIFCFDLMLIELATAQGMGPGFLIHDSHLFDGVDERQVAKALQLGAERAAAKGFQYIVTMNSDALPADGFKPGFDIGKFVLETRLTDATEDGGLFGMRFN